MNTENKTSKVLIIEDDAFLAELLVKHVQRKAGIEVSLALDAETGLAKVKEQRPDLILLDLLLPGMNGYEFLEKIKADPELSSIAVIVLSNLGQKEEIDRALKLGALDFLVKSHYDLDEIVTRIKLALDKIKKRKS